MTGGYDIGNEAKKERVKQGMKESSGNVHTLISGQLSY
jgi:hypothetical protein